MGETCKCFVLFTNLIRSSPHRFSMCYCCHFFLSYWLNPLGVIHHAFITELADMPHWCLTKNNNFFNFCHWFVFSVLPTVRFTLYPIPTIFEQFKITLYKFGGKWLARR